MTSMPSSSGGRRPVSTPSAEHCLRIDRIGADGDGVAGADSGKPTYVPCTLPGETIRARIIGARGEALAIVTPSDERISPPCPHFGACGGCALQHWREDAYLRWKEGLLHAALRRAGFGDVPMRPLVRTPPGARRRLDLALRRAPSGVRIGLHRLRGSEIVDLETCTVARPALLALVAPLRTLLAATGLLRREGSAVFNLLDTGADLLLRTDAEPNRAARAALVRFAEANRLPRIAWARGGGVPEPICVLRPPTLSLSGVTVAPPPGAFLQASVEGERGIVASVLAGLPAGVATRAPIIELYAGCGTLTFALAATGHRVAAFDADAAAIGAMRTAANHAGLAGRVTPTVRDLARRPLMAAEIGRAPAVLLDPPFAGAPAQMAELAKARPDRVIYVSCNPAALARDAAALSAAGYRLEAATLIDQFLWSSRIEGVAVFAQPAGVRKPGLRASS